ncbi:hypothetical protein ACIQD2_11760 [Dietzia maris]
MSDSSPISAIMLAADGAFQVAGLGIDVVRGAGQLAVGALQTTRAVRFEALHAASRLIRSGQIRPRTRISFAKTERARNHPNDACFLCSDRIHRFSAADTRITNVAKGLYDVDRQRRPATRVRGRIAHDDERWTAAQLLKKPSSILR